MLIIVVVWAITHRHVVAHSSIQAILVIACFPIVNRMLRSDRNTESFFMWIGLLLARIFSLVSSQGTLATVYAVRAIICTSTLLALMIQAEWRARRIGVAPSAGAA